MSAFAEQKAADGLRKAVCDGHFPKRECLTGLGGVDVHVPARRVKRACRDPENREFLERRAGQEG